MLLLCFLVACVIVCLFLPITERSIHFNTVQSRSALALLLPVNRLLGGENINAKKKKKIGEQKCRMSSLVVVIHYWLSPTFVFLTTSLFHSPVFHKAGVDYSGNTFPNSPLNSRGGRVLNPLTGRLRPEAQTLSL